MLRTYGNISVVAALGLCVAVIPGSSYPTQASEVAPTPRPKHYDPLPTSAISTLLAVNGGEPPATGEQFWKSLSKLGAFAQFPIVFSAVKLDSGLGNPRVVIAPVALSLSDAAANEPNIIGRLYFAANMEKDPRGGDPRVTSVEFISWNTARRQFDFGVIENMGHEGSANKPDFRIVDGGKCFSCHKNRGPILGDAPWTNSTQFSLVRNLVSKKLGIVGILPPGAPARLRDRIDGMALVSPETILVDDSIRVGRQMKVYRETFRLMNRYALGRKAFVTLLLGILEPGVLDLNNSDLKRQINSWNDDPAHSFQRFEQDWLNLLKTTNSGILCDCALSKVLVTPGGGWGDSLKPLPPLLPGAFSHDYWTAKSYQWPLEEAKANNKAFMEKLAENTSRIAQYDEDRSDGRHGMTGTALPSNPKAFLKELPTPPRSPSGLVNTVMLAGTIGLTTGDRHFLIHALDEAADRLKSRKISPRTLARAIFEGPEFADVLAGGPLPDRDEFKDRFVTGLDRLLKTKYMLKEGFNPNRRDYAYGPRYDPNAAEETEAVVVPTTACLRRHDVRPTGKARFFEAIPALAFDPLDEQAREAWLKSAPKDRKRHVLSRLLVRLFKDSDMPPSDSPEHEQFRVKEAAAFDQVKDFLERELDKVR